MFPTTLRILFTDVVPVVAPIETVDAAPPIFKVVAFKFTKSKLSELVVILPPFAAILPEKFESSAKKLSTFTLKETLLNEVAARTVDVGLVSRLS